MRQSDPDHAFSIKNSKTYAKKVLSLCPKIIAKTKKRQKAISKAVGLIRKGYQTTNATYCYLFLTE